MLVAIIPWFARIINYLVVGVSPPGATKQQLNKIFHDLRFYFWDEPYLFKQGSDQLWRRCISEEEVPEILKVYHKAPYKGHFIGMQTTAKVLQSDYFWPTLFCDAHKFVQSCDKCQQTRNLTARSEMPMNYILEVENFNV